jgi:C4-dicarboxylate-specific signal transduction histidine kinase
MAEIGTLSAGIAHEINNPLSIIRGKASVLIHQLDSNMEDKVVIKKGLQQIEKTADRISKIVKGLKTTTRNAENDPFIDVSLASIWDDIEILYHDKITKHGINFQRPTGDDLKGVLVNCRPAELSQVFINLIMNSVDAIEKIPKPWIRVEFSTQTETIRLRFFDAGSGIPDEIVQKLMQPFFTTKEFGKGTGLGLSISRTIIENHKGKLFLDQTCSNTCFVIELPRVAAKLNSLRLEEAA